MSQAAFDPCRQWLGIDAVELGDPRRVVGVSPTESDPLVVLRSAEARLSSLRNVPAGPFELARSALLKRVEEAREAVLRQIAEMPREAFPTSTSFAMPPPPAGHAGPPPGVAMASAPMPPPVPMPMPPVPRAGSPWEPPGAPAAPFGQSPPFVPVPATGWAPTSRDVQQPVGVGDASEPGVFDGPRATPRYRRQSSSGGLLALLGGLCVVAAALAVSVLQPKPDRASARRPNPEELVRRQPDPDQAPGDDAAGRRDESPARRTKRPMRPPAVEEQPDPASDRAVSTSEPPVRMDSPPPDAETAAMSNRPASQDQDGGSSAGEAAMPQGTPRTVEDSPTAEPPMKPEVSVDRPPPDEAAATAAVDAEPVRPKPAPDERPAPAPRGDEPDDAPSRIESLLVTAHAALQRREHDTVERTLASAEKIATDRASIDRIARWRGFAHYAREFFTYRDQALDAVEAGHEYDVDGKKIGVVEIDADKFIYRFKGRNKTVPRDAIPSGIVLTIVTDWFDARPENQLFLGAYHLAKPECDPDAARAAWEMGAAAGADASQLLPLLDDPVIRKAGDQ